MDNEEFRFSLPRSETMDGDDLSIIDVIQNGSVIVSDGERTAAYVPHDGDPLKGPDIRIVPKYVEAGAFTEANVLTLTDGERTAVYVPSGR
jgi:hypothetical protein